MGKCIMPIGQVNDTCGKFHYLEQDNVWLHSCVVVEYNYLLGLFSAVYKSFSVMKKGIPSSTLHCQLVM